MYIVFFTTIIFLTDLYVDGQSNDQGLSNDYLAYSRSILEWIPYVKRRDTAWTIERQAFFVRRPTNPPISKYSGASDLLLTNARWITEIYNETGPRFLANFTRKYSVVFVDRNLRYKDNPIKAEIANVIIHPEYRGKINDTNDIAMIKLRKTVKFSKYFQPIEPTMWNISDVTNCTLTGWNMRFDYDDPDQTSNQTSKTRKSMKAYYAGAIAYASNVTNVDGHLESSIQHVGDGNAFWTSTGAPLICKKNDQFYAQGLVSDQSCKMVDIVSREYCDMNAATLVDLSAQYAWIMDTLNVIDTSRLFHSDISLYELSLQQPIHTLNATYVDHWYAKSIYEKIIVKKGQIGVGCLRGITTEQNVYGCIINCFLKNGGKPCSYIGKFQKCLYADDDVEPERDSEQAISIYFSN